VGGSLKAEGFGDGQIAETIPNPFDFAQGSAALEVATLPNYQIRFDKLLRLIVKQATSYLLPLEIRALTTLLAALVSFTSSMPLPVPRFREYSLSVGLFQCS
jgi:hypothetical protein